MSAAEAYAPNRYHCLHLHQLSLKNAPTKPLVGASLKGYSLDCITFRTATELIVLDFKMKILNTAGIPMMSIDFWRCWADTGKIAVKGYTRSDDTPLHKAVREACVNMVIHADYMLTGTLKVIKTVDGFEITNPGVLKIPKEQIYQGGNSKARNPRIQSMLRMVGYGDNVGSGFPTILNAWKGQVWKTPELMEDKLE